MTNLNPASSLLRRIAECRRAGVSVLATIALPVLVGASGLAFDLNRGYQQRIINQRAADMGALGAAMAYKASSNSTVLQPTARDIAIANGLAGATVTAAVVNNVPTAGASAVRVTVNQPVPYALGRVLGFTGTFDVRAQSMASLTAAMPPYASPCYLALFNGANALRLSGGATINAPACSVAAVGSIYNDSTGITGANIISGSGNIETTWGYLTANTLRFAGSFTKPDWNNSVPSADKRNKQATTLTDPWANSSERLVAMAQIGTYASTDPLGNPPTPSGTNWNFTSSNPGTPVAAWRQGTSSEYVVPTGNYTIGSLVIGGDVKVTFQNGSNITIANGVNNGGRGLDFGNSNVYINGGFNAGWGSGGVRFGDGALRIGSGTVNFTGTTTKGNGDVVINSTVNLGGGSNLTMGNGLHQFDRVTLGGGGWVKLGTGNLQISKGVNIDGDSELSVGEGDVVIGKHSDGTAINLSGSARFFMRNGAFSANGNIETQGGSKLVFGDTPNHYINGNMNVRGAALFGRGRYLINGSFINGTGGTTWPYTSALTGITYGNTLHGTNVSGYDMAGVNVSFFLSGTVNLAGGAKTLLEAATTSGNGAVGELLISSMTTASTTWSAGAQSRFGGVVHLPNSDVAMSGGNSTAGGSGCFSLVSRTISVTGGAVTGSACGIMAQAIGGGGSTAIRLVG